MFNKLQILLALFLLSFSMAISAQNVLKLKPLSFSDDAELILYNSDMRINSSDLELGGYDTGDKQAIAVRFPQVSLPVGANILSAYIQFTVDEIDNQDAIINIKAQLGNATTYSDGVYNDITVRDYTNGTVTWNASIWDTKGERGEKQRTPDLTAIINEAMVSGFNYDNNDALAFYFSADTQKGNKEAESLDSGEATAPELIINYIIDPIAVMPLTGVLVINEVTGSGTAQNNNDWIELYNTSNALINLDGVSISDKADEPFKYVFDESYMNGESFKLFEADNYFNIKAKGETLYLFQTIDGMTTLIDTLEARETVSNTSYGRKPDGSAAIVDFNTATPGSSNNLALELIDIEFSQPRGVYTSAITVELSSPQGGNIKYTTNSSSPSLNNGTLYTGPIQVNNNTVIKAVAYTEYAASKVITNTYIINNNVGYQAVPVLSVSTINSIESQSESACTVEYIDKYGEGTSTFADAGFFVFGNASVHEPKKNFRFKFRSSYGYSKFEHPIFEQRAIEDYKPETTFNSFDLKAGQDYNNGLGGSNMSSIMARGYLRQMGNVEPHVRHVHVFMNGNYHGVYNLREHFSSSYAKDYFGTEKENLDRLDGTSTVRGWINDPTVDGGSINAWNELKSYAKTDFQEVKARVEIDQFIDFMLFHFLNGFEWEYRAIADTGFDTTKFRFHWNDFDGFIRDNFIHESHYRNKLNTSSGRGPGDLFYLAGFGGSNLEYMTMVKDRVLTLFDGSNTNGVLSIENYTKQINDFREVYRGYNELEYNRWGQMNSSGFEQKINNYLDFLPTRFNETLEFLNGKGLVHNIAPVAFSEPEGRIALNTPVTINNGTANTQVYYTIGGDDVVLDNTLTGILYTPGEPLPLTEGVNIVKARAFSNGNLGVLTEVSYNVISPLNITGINYNPLVEEGLEKDDFEFLLLTNNGNETRTVAQDSIKGINFKFPEGAYIEAGETVMLARSNEVYPSMEHRRILWLTEAGVSPSKLSNGGEKLTWKKTDNTVINLLEYDDKAPWPELADGDGYYLKLKQDDLDNAMASNWEAVELPSTLETLTKKQFNLEAAVSLYPVPAGDELNIELKANFNKVNVKIYDLSGKLLLEAKQAVGKVITLDVSNVASGIYLLKLAVDENQVLRKIIKK